MTGPALAIRRFALTVEAPPARARGAARLAEQAVRDFLPAALAGRTPAGPDDALLMIRRIELDLTLGDGEDARRIADRLAAAISLAIAGASAPAQEGDGPRPADEGAMPRFASRAALAAAFLAALAEGRGTDGWWFRSFEGVRLLSPSAAARTVLLREPAAIGEVFAALDPAARSRLAGLLGGADAALLLDALTALPSAGTGEPGWVALAAALGEAGARAPLPRAVEALMIMAARGRADIGGEIAAAARAAARFLATGASPHRPSSAAHPRSSGPAVRRQTGGDLPEALRAALTALERNPVESRPDTPLFSPLGGYALLLPSLLELDLAALSAGWPVLSGAAPERGLQLLVLAAAAGDRRLLDDPFWRRLLALPPRLAVADLAAWLDDAPPLGPIESVPAGGHRGVALPAGLGTRRTRRAIAALARRTLGRFAGRLPGFASASAAFLRTNLLGSGATLCEADGVLRVRLERPPLDVLLSITGAAERELALADGRLVRLERRE